jgi:hypothetical protein
MNLTCHVPLQYLNVFGIDITTPRLDLNIQYSLIDIEIVSRNNNRWRELYSD